MENASKALIIVGSLLMSMMVIGLLVFMFNNISDVKQTESDAEFVEKSNYYSSKFESYNRKIYGSELLSLTNLCEDYNRVQGEMRGYEEITIKVKINRQIDVNGIIYFSSSGNQTSDDIFLGKEKIESKIEEYEVAFKNNSTMYKGKTVSYYSTKSYKEIALLFGYDYDDVNIRGKTDYEIGEYLATYGIPDVKDLINDINEYKILKSSYTEFKNKRFKCQNIEYGDVSGRITLMEFVEI